MSADVYRVVIPGSPGAAKVNTRTTPIVRGKHARVILSEPYRAWRDVAVGLMREAVPAGRSLPWADGMLEVKVLAFWPKSHRTGPAAGAPLGDVDAVAKACMDALGHAGILDDDAQVMRLICVKSHDKAAPRIEIRLRAFEVG